MIYDNSGVRRQDRLLTEAEARGLLAAGGIRRAVDVRRRRGLRHPRELRVDGAESLYIHCAPEGRKLRCVAASPRVSFCVTAARTWCPNVSRRPTKASSRPATPASDCPKRSACGHSGCSWRNMLRGLEAVGRKYAEKSFHRTQIIRLDIRTFSGKCNRVAL